MKKNWLSRLIFAALLHIPLSSSAQTSETDGFFPIDLGRAGSSATVKVHVSRFSKWLTKGNPVSLALQIAPSKKKAISLQQFQNLIFSLTGEPYPSRTEAQIANPAPHREIRFHVVWIDNKSGTILRERDVSSGHNWEGRIHAISGTSFDLDSMVLSAGDFSIVVTTLSDDSRFDGTLSTGLCAGINLK